MRRSPDSPAQPHGLTRTFFTVLVAALLLALIPLKPATAAEGPPKFIPGDLPGAIVAREQTFEGKALYGYIDGGAELYFEYGFRRAVVQEIVSETLHVHLEIFEMISGESAAGIFSVTSRGCAPDRILWSFTCASRFHAQEARGRYYVRAANVSGAPAESSLTASIVGLVASKIKDSAYSPPTLFLDSLFLSGQRSFILARGPLGLENGLDEWRDIGEAVGKFSLSVLVQESGTIETKIGLLEYGSEERNVFDPAGWAQAAPPGFLRSVIVNGGRRLILVETTGDRAALERCQSVLDRYRTDMPIDNRQ